MLVHMSVIYMLTKSAILYCQFLFLTEKKILVVFCGAPRFFASIFEKMDQRNYIKKFCVQNEMKCARRIEMLTVAFGESTMSRT